ncbi:MAG: ATP-binding protein [Labilithrix sp.]
MMPHRAVVVGPELAPGAGVHLALLEVLPDALFVVRDERIAWANAAALRLLGARLVGRPLDDVLAPEQRLRLDLQLKQRADGWPLPATFRVRFVHLDKPDAIVVADVRVGADEHGLLLSARDITEQTRAEALMGRLADVAASGDALLDAETLLTAASPVFLALGWVVAFTELVPGGSITRRIIAAEGDPVGEYGRSLIGVEMPMTKTPILEQAVSSGAALFLDNVPSLLAGMVSGATRLGASMERAQVIRSVWCPIRNSGVVTHHLAVTGRDLTEHDFVALQLFAAQLGAALHLATLRSELVHKERLAAVGEMAAVMAHEVRNPLSVMFNAVAGLRKMEVDGPLLEIIQEEAERLQRLVTDLLDYSRPAAVERQVEDVGTLLRHAIRAAQTESMVDEGAHPIHLDGPDEPFSIETDPRLLHRALVNLLVNALQNVSPNGRVSIAARSKDGQLELVVHNDGGVVDRDLAERIFEPFFTTRPSGTGLGLAVVRRIAGDLGGAVSLDVAVEDGTSFVLRLPLVP